MGKKIILITIAILIVAIGIGVFYLYKPKPIKSSAINAIPINSAFVIECKDLPKLFTELQNNNKIWKEISNIENISILETQVKYLDSLINIDADIKNILGNNSMFISSHLKGRQDFKYLFTFSLPQLIESNDVYETIKKYIGGKANISKREYSNVDIYDVKFQKNKKIKDFTFSSDKGVLFFSYSSLLVENAIRQLNTGASLLTNKSFEKVRKTAGQKVIANMYVNYKEFSKLFSIFLNDKNQETIASFTNFAEWSEFDINIKSDEVLLNGFTCTKNPSSNYLNIFLQQSEVDMDIEEVLPANTSTFIRLGFSNLGLFKKDYNTYLEKTFQIEKHNNRLKSIKTKYNIDIEKTFYSIIDDEVALAYTNINSLDINQNTYVIFKTVGKSKSEEIFANMLAEYVANKNVEISDLTHRYKPDTETSIPIYKIPVKFIGEILFGKLFSSAKMEYCTFIDNYLVFGNSKKSVNKFIHYNLLKKTLEEDVSYKEFADNLSAKSNFHFYSNVSRSPLLYSTILNKKLTSGLEKNITIFQKFKAIAFQFSATDNNMAYNNLFAKYDTIYSEPPRTIWESHLDTIIEMKPKIVTNHRTNEKEIFVQDVDNNIYLINSFGRILWKVPLNEKIISDISQIDYYKNTKLQYIFNTKSQIHLIDRLGNYVERYPLRLRSPATNSIAVFDYEKNRNYRIFIACENKQVYAYSKEGDILEGWEFDKTENIVDKKIQHFKVKDKDYIVFADTKKIYLLDRRGKIRIKPEKDFQKSANNKFTLEFNKKPEEAAFVTTDTAGVVQFIYTTGKIKSYNVSQFSSSHFFDYKDINGDGKKEFIFLDKNTLEAFNFKKSIFEHKFENEINIRPSLYGFSKNEIKIGVVSNNDNKIYLFNSNGTIYEGFPLIGKTLFSIGHFKNSQSKFNLLVGSNDNFLYNYEVH